MAYPHFPNTQMVVKVNPTLKIWWRDIEKNRGLEANELLGGLTALISVEPDRYLIKALLKFWDTERLVFKFKDFELTPTIEEIGGFLGLPYKEQEMIVPHKPTPRSFLKQMGMRHNPDLLCLKEGWISLEFLYARFGDEEGYENFSREFACSSAKWEKYRLNAFAVALLGSLVFPMERGKIHTSLSYVVRMLARGGKTIVPMILAEIIRALTKCTRGKRYFEGCNFLLQLWAVEHFYQRANMVDIIRGSMGNKISNHASRMKYFVSPVGTEDWFVYLRERSATQIQWKYYWLKPRRAIIRGNELYFIELVGLNGVQPYAPLRVLRQFGQIQMIPLRSHMSHYGYDFGSEIPHVSTILRRWERVMTIDVQEHRPFCTPEYYVWLLEDAEHTDLSEEGISGFGDERERRWARNLLNNNYEITPEMKQQIVPNIGD
ncbi:hypothetical protein R3W88_033783 [Solanum pinnatisectum]|uniref:Aminotransferase-like plant mobile domain-containing protein n=1 Tax=Solanum pinnatisectum TaxID=50273 RepID=A0AAV9JZZ7_9SOLN|nr:hypothetical protein R3W88_033783 [Solanum pinnatisectum]